MGKELCPSCRGQDFTGPDHEGLYDCLTCGAWFRKEPPLTIAEHFHLKVCQYLWPRVPLFGWAARVFCEWLHNREDDE